MTSLNADRGGQRAMLRAEAAHLSALLRDQKKALKDMQDGGHAS